MDIPLRCCPFCGSTNLEWNGYFLECLNVECAMSVTFNITSTDYRNESAKRFNKRAIPGDLLIELLKKKGD